MHRKFFTIIFALALLPALLFAQENVILMPTGKVVKNKEELKNKSLDVREVKKTARHTTGINNSNNQNLPLGKLSQLGTIDTLQPPPPYAANFVHYGQDVMVMWYKAPADLNLLKVGFACYQNDDNVEVDVKVVKVNWTDEQIFGIGASTRMGYYEATGNGYNDATAFLDNADRTGEWTSFYSADPSEVFGNDIWSDVGTGYTMLPVADQTLPFTYQWLDLSLLEVPQLLSGEIFAIAIKNKNTTMGDNGANTIGYWYNSANPDLNLFKYYAQQRLAPGDHGWWHRTEYSLAIAAIVELTGDRAPVIQSFTVLPSGIDVGPYTVNAVITDDNPGDPGNAGITSAILKWSIDDGTTWNDVEMTGTEPDFTGQIPAQVPGTTVKYYIETTDVASLTNKSSTKEFYVFAPSGVPTLVIFNGFDAVSGYPQNYYFGSDVRSGKSTFPHDRWAYGRVPDILDNYTNVIEILNGSSFDYNEDAIRTWLEGDAGRNYFLAGQEYLGAKNGYVDSTYSAGSFEYDILGILNGFNDISYDGTEGQALPSLVWPQAGTAFGQPLLDLFNSLTPPADSMMYNPTFETGGDNWQDGFNIVSGVGVEVDMWVETRGIAGDPAVDTLATQLHRTLPAGNKIAFLSYDPIALNTAVDDSYPYYNWIGYDNANTPYQVLDWFGIVLDVKEVGGATPTDFSLAQNYPNPFNPSTTINFTVPQTAKVTLKVFDILGREVATLVNETKGPGNYAVDFDASSLSSGMYIYTINAGDFTTSRKMMLLK